MQSPFRLLVFLFVMTLAYTASGQLPLSDQEIFARLKGGAALPDNLLSTRTAVFYSPVITEEELSSIQSSFQRAGLDAVAYFENDLLTAGRDVAMATGEYLLGREISNLALVQKQDTRYTLFVTPFNRKADFVDKDQPSWVATNKSLEEISKTLYRASGSLKRENFLINDIPETGLAINPIRGKRADFFAIDLKVDPLAVPKFGDEVMDKELEEIMKMYPYKYTLIDPNLSERELRSKGLLFVLRFVKARAGVARDVLGYATGPSKDDISSYTYSGGQQEPHIKNISANTEVFKFYFKHIDSGNVYLGTQWDADTTWQQALINQLRGFLVELKIK